MLVPANQTSDVKMVLVVSDNTRTVIGHFVLSHGPYAFERTPCGEQIKRVPRPAI